MMGNMLKDAVVLHQQCDSWSWVLVSESINVHQRLDVVRGSGGNILFHDYEDKFPVRILLRIWLPIFKTFLSDPFVPVTQRAPYIRSFSNRTQLRRLLLLSLTALTNVAATNNCIYQCKIPKRSKF